MKKPAPPLEPSNNNLLPKELLEKLLSAALSRGGDFADVYIQRSRQTSIPLEERKVRLAEIRAVYGVGIRVISGERTGYAYSDDLEPSVLMETARTAAHIASGSAAGATEVRMSTAPDYHPITIKPSEVSVAHRASIMKRANKAAYEYDPRVKQVDVYYSDEERDIAVANSEGLWVTDHQTMLRLYVRCVARDRTTSRSGSYGGGGRIGMEYFDQVAPEELAREAARIAVVQLDSIPAPAGTMPVVINGGWGGVLFHEAVGHGLEADFTRKGISIYTGRIGEKVACELCTIVDDASLPNRRGSYDIDDEGVPGRRSVLIEKGVLKGYMTDRLNAKLTGLPLTGNGRRENYQCVPIPRMSCFFMEVGEHDSQELIKSIGKGVYARGLGGGQVDITNGNFVFSVSEGYLIENGKVGAPIRGATLIGNGPDVLNKVSMVGSDLALDPGIGTCGKNGQGVPTSVGMPTVKISELTVGGTAT